MARMPGTSRLFPCGRLVPGGWAERRSFSGEGSANRATTPATRTSKQQGRTSK